MEAVWLFCVAKRWNLPDFKSDEQNYNKDEGYFHYQLFKREENNLPDAIFVKTGARSDLQPQLTK